jgi:GTPase KRas protein
MEANEANKPSAMMEDDVGIPKQTIKLAILGPGGCGKSCLAVKWLTNNYVGDYSDATVEDNYKVAQVVDGTRMFLEITDTAGIEEYSFMHDQWIRQNEAFVLVYAIDNADSFKIVQDVQTKIERCCREDGRICAIVLVGNKSDCCHGKRQVRYEEGQSLAKQWGARFLETSAKEAYNVTECFHEAVRASIHAKSQNVKEETVIIHAIMEDDVGVPKQTIKLAILGPSGCGKS